MVRRNIHLRRTPKAQHKAIIMASADDPLQERDGHVLAFVNNDHLTLKIDAYDLSRQLSSTSYSVNAQGRTETWQRSLSAYVMARVAYKFDLMPNGK